jgi:hypothetical protein
MLFMRQRTPIKMGLKITQHQYAYYRQPLILQIPGMQPSTTPIRNQTMLVAEMKLEEICLFPFAEGSIISMSDILSLFSVAWIILFTLAKSVSLFMRIGDRFDFQRYVSHFVKRHWLEIRC